MNKETMIENEKPVLHLMVNNTCTNNCPLCCNKQYNVDDIPVVTVEELRSIDTICFTGGQPLLNIKNFADFCSSLESSYPNIRTCYVYMNGAELFSYINQCNPKTKMMFRRFPMNTKVSYGLTMSPKCSNDWRAIRELRPHMKYWKSNRIYCFSDRDVYNAGDMFNLGEVEIVRREWQENFTPAPNTIFRRLPVWVI